MVVLQVYQSFQWIKKADYKILDKNNIHHWHLLESLNYASFKDNKFTLSNNLANSIADNVDVIILKSNLSDVENEQLIVEHQKGVEDIPIQNNNSLITINEEVNQWNLSFLQINYNRSDATFDIHLKPDYLGDPIREPHRLAILRMGNTLKYCVNGKSDFTLTGRKQRTYLEVEYLFNYLGIVSDIQSVKQNQFVNNLSVPTSYTKIVDERKILW